MCVRGGGLREREWERERERCVYVYIFILTCIHSCQDNWAHQRCLLSVYSRFENKVPSSVNTMMGNVQSDPQKHTAP